MKRHLPGTISNGKPGTRRLPGTLATSKAKSSPSVELAPLQGASFTFPEFSASPITWFPELPGTELSALRNDAQRPDAALNR